MLLGFQKQFVPYVREGSKTHTIRGERKRGERPVPGETLHLYTGLRQKGAEFILRAPCLRTEERREFDVREAQAIEWALDKIGAVKQKEKA